MNHLQHWAQWPFDEGWTGEEPVLTVLDQQIELASQLLQRRFASWDECADYARLQATDLQEELREAQLLFAISRAKQVTQTDVLSKLNRPEAHLARRRDRLLTQIRAEEARLDQLGEEAE